MNTFSNQELASARETANAHAPELPSAALNVVESAVELVRAEVSLAAAAAKESASRWLTVAFWGLLSLVLLPVALVVLTLGALMQPSPATFSSWAIAVAPSLLLAVTVIATYVALRKVLSDDHV